MFNVRPEALAPWLHVEPLPADEVPGFRMNPDGSVRDTQRGTASRSFGFDPSASPSPLTGFQDAMGFSGNIDVDAYLTGGPMDFAASPRNPLQDALDEITRIYARFVPRPSGPFDGQGAGTAMVSSSGGQQLSPYAAGSQTSEPSVPAGSPRPARSDDLPMTGGLLGFPGSNFAQLAPRVTPPQAPESSEVPANQENLQPSLHVTSPTISPGTSALDSSHKGLPRLGSDEAADPNIVPVGNGDAAERGSPQVAQAQQDNRETETRDKVEDPLDALGHYVWGSGKTVEYPFKQIDTNGVTPSQFPAVETILLRGQPGTYKIEGKMPFSTRNLNARYLVGNITLNINGTLVLDEEGNYSFKGELGAEPDRYRFYSSDHRDTDAEIATRLGKLLPGREFTVVISGRNPISQTGKYR